MSISAVGSSLSSTAYDNTTKKRASTDDPMAAAISKLKTSDPELADKLQKISDRRAELKKSGATEEEARTTIDKEFGKPTQAEMQKIADAGGAPRAGGPGGPHGAGGPKGPPPPQGGSSSNSKDTDESTETTLQALLDSVSTTSTSNNSVLEFLKSRELTAASSD